MKEISTFMSPLVIASLPMMVTSTGPGTRRLEEERKEYLQAFEEEKFRVIGINNYTSIINRNAVVVELADLQEITFRTGAVTFIAVKLAPPGGPEEADRVAKAIEGLGQLSVTKSESVLKNDSLIGLLSAVSTAMAWVAHGGADGIEHAEYLSAPARSASCRPSAGPSGGSWGRW
jgi:hypothetical protein